MLRVRRISVEFLVIVAGVLVALAVDEWNDVRRARVQESVYLERLLDDLRMDTTTFSPGSNGGAERNAKIASLTALLEVAPRSVLEEEALRAVARDLAAATIGSWGSLPTMRITYDELISTGSLGLIRDADVRRRIAVYYQNHEFFVGRLDQRLTDFPRFMYGLIRRGGGEGGAQDFESADLTATELDRLRDALSTPEYAAALTAELNRTLNQRSVYRQRYAEAVDLLRTLEAYLQGL